MKARNRLQAYWKKQAEEGFNELWDSFVLSAKLVA